MKSTILTTLALLVSAAFLQAQEATAVKPTVLSKMANGTKLHQFDGTSMASAKLTKAPEYYILYFSASWWGPCRRGAPQLVEKYNTVVAKNPKFEMIHISLDRDSRAAGGWAVDDKLPWLHIMPESAESSGFLKYKSTQYVPEYALVKADGTRLATDGEVFPMAKKLAAE